MDKAELMQKEIENKRKLPEEIKKDIKKNIFHNILIAFIIILYLCTINILFYKLENNVFEQQMKFFALGTITITVIVFEIAYRRQSKRTCMIGIELLLCSIISLYIPYIYLFAEVDLKMITTILPLSIAGYYMIKAYLIYKSGKIKHENNLSDVKEILKDTEKQSYIDEESTKTYRELKDYEEKTKQELIEEQHKRAKANKAKKKTANKANRTKKVTNSKEDKSAEVKSDKVKKASKNINKKENIDKKDKSNETVKKPRTKKSSVEKTK